MKFSDELTANALTEQLQPISSPMTLASALKWSLGATDAGAKQYLLPSPETDWSNWRDPKVGWGLILPYRSEMTARQLAAADDAPEPIRELQRLRNAPVFRYRRDWRDNTSHIRNYAANKSVPLGGGEIGIAKDALPYYLLIYASPKEIPWRFQYVLNTTRAVGRLELSGLALENYISALMNDWESSRADITRPVVWAAENGDAITRLMRQAVAEKVYRSLKSDSDIRNKAQFINGSDATCEQLIASLERTNPGLVVTTSHGRTDPWKRPREMRVNLGRMVDVNKQTLDGKDLLAAWQPNGAIWYALACCSAGSDGGSVFAGLVEEQNPIGQLLKAVARVGPMVAPLPKAMLGARKPLRSFIGHVEPTFNWTLRQPDTATDQTIPLRAALYDNLYRWKPVGLAFKQFYDRVAVLSAQHDEERDRYNAGKATETRLIYSRLAAWDIRTTVILGDPTVTLAALPVTSKQRAH